jgi:hypothetical protein
MFSGWTLQLFTGPSVTLNQDVSVGSSPTFNAIFAQSISGATLNYQTGSFNSLTVQDALHMQSGAFIDSLEVNADTVYIDGHLNVSNLVTIDAITGLTSFANYTGSQIYPSIVIDGIHGKLYATGASGAGYFKELFVSTGSLHIGENVVLSSQDSQRFYVNQGIVAPSVLIQNGLQASTGVFTSSLSSSYITATSGVFSSLSSQSLSIPSLSGSSASFQTLSATNVIASVFTGTTVYASTLKGTNATLTDIVATNLTSSVFTGTTVYASTLKGETGVFTNLQTNVLSLDASGTSTITYNQSQTGFVFNHSIYPSSSELTIGSFSNPWKSIYVSTGTVFLGATGSLIVNDNGSIASNVGFAAPIYQVGSTTPGNGIVLYSEINQLYYLNQFGESGPVSIFKTASNSINNTYFTGGNLGIGTSVPSTTLDVVGDIKTNKVNFQGVGSMYMQTGSYTGCFIDKMNYNPQGTNHYVYYNSNSGELAHASPDYFYSYSTGTQSLTASSTAGASSFQPVTFNVNNILYHNFTHTDNSSVFTGTFTSPVTLQLTYSLQMHSTTNGNNSAAAVLYLDGSPIAGSYRSCSLTDTGAEYPLSNTVLVNIPSGSHAIQLRAAVTDRNNIFIGGTPNILPPGTSYTSANLFCVRVL